MSGDSGSFSVVSCHVGGDWRVRCITYADRTPILTVDAGALALSVSTMDNEANGAAVEFAQALADSARKFADEMERMHAAQLDGDRTDKAAGSDAA